MLYLYALILIITSYLIGSLPFGFWLAKIVKGKSFDIRDWGSHNIGATNVLRVLGWKIAIPVFILDFSKGYFTVLIALFLFPKSELVAILCCVAAVLGHAKSIIMFLREKDFGGGKSVATVFGGLIALQPMIAIIAFGIFLLMLLIFRYVSLASMTACLSTIILAVIFKEAWYWPIILGTLSLFIIAKHRRNIGQLIDRLEPKFGEKRGAHGEGDETVVAFGIHSLSLEDIGQSAQSRWILDLFNKGLISNRVFNYIIEKAPALKVGEIVGTTKKQNRKVRVHVTGTILTPEMIKDPQKESLVEAIIKSMIVLVKRCGAGHLGLGALLSTIPGMPTKLEGWARERGFDMVLDNGGACTAAATIIALRRMRPNYQSMTIAIISASGVIGTALRLYFKHLGIGLILLARDERKLDNVDQQKEHIAKDLDGLADADIIITTTSSPDFIFTLENHEKIKQNALIMDVARPIDFDDEILKIRPDLELVRCGLIRFPGAMCNIDFHFGGYFPACLIQVIILALKGKDNRSTKTIRISPQDIEWFIAKLDEFGFEVDVSLVDEYGVFSGGNNEHTNHLS